MPDRFDRPIDGTPCLARIGCDLMFRDTPSYVTRGAAFQYANGFRVAIVTLIA
jgi:hypothetical protein